jgi:nucleoside-diphosphate-sugar epimerase
MVLVTGGTGFLGAYIIKELVEKGFAVRAIRRSNKLPSFIPSHVFSTVEWVDGDILDVVSIQDALDGADTVIHSAAIISFSPDEKEEMYRVNIEGTANVVNMSLEKNIKRFVHISSVAALGRTPQSDHVNEEKKWQDSRVNTHYAISKHLSELEVWRGIAEGLNAVIINPSTIIGFGDWNTSSTRLFKNIYNEFPWYTTGINGFVDVEDVATATVALMLSEVSAEAFIVSSENWPFQQLFNVIADNFGKRRPFRRATPLLAQVAWRIEKIKALWGQQPLLTKESARVAHSQTYFNNTKILHALPGFSFKPLEKSIQKACKMYLETIKSMQP